MSNDNIVIRMSLLSLSCEKNEKKTHMTLHDCCAYLLRCSMGTATRLVDVSK